MERGGIIVGQGEVIGVAVHAVTAEALVLAHVHLHRRKDGVHVRAQGEATDLAGLAATYGTRIPVALTMDTDRCVHRVLQRTGEPDELLRQAFPNAALDELSTSVWKAGPATGLSMARRSAVTEVVARFHALGFRVVRVSIGPWALLGLRALLGEEAEAWSSGGHSFTFDDGLLTAHAATRTTEGPTIQLDADRIEDRHALAFAGAWAHLVPTAERQDTPLPEVVAAQREERARYRYERGLLVAAVLFVLVIGGERAVAYQLARSRSTLKSSATTQARDREALEALRANVQAMEGIGEELGLGRSDGLALQAARVAATVPSGIRLDRLVEHPLRGPLKEREPLATERGIVRVSGTCRDAGALDAWMSVLKGTAGLSTVKLLGYSIDPETSTPRFELELAP